MYPRPPRRIVDPYAGIQKVTGEGRCRVCGSRWAISRAHLVPKGQRGDDIDDNIVPLCGGGTDGCHGSLTDHHLASWPSLLTGVEWTAIAALLRERLSSDEEGYILQKKGIDWLNRVYPAKA